MPHRTGALIADIGGTNIRLASIGPNGEPGEIAILRCADYPDPAAAVEEYFDRISPTVRPTVAAFAVASPIQGDRIQMTNHPWSFSIAELESKLRFDRLMLVNDFSAIALSVPRLAPHHLSKIGGGKIVHGHPVGVIGPGTGLGVSGLIRTHGHASALTSEGGHVTMAPATDRESDVLMLLRRRLGHVSAERVISGEGLVHLYATLAELEQRTAERLTPEIVTDRAREGSCPVCSAAVDMFCSMLGTAAANLALTLGARGGIYIAGGIVPKLGELFARSGFRQRFETMGRFSAYMTAIPTYVITHEIPAFLGLAALLDRDIATVVEAPDSGL